MSKNLTEAIEEYRNAASDETEANNAAFAAIEMRDAAKARTGRALIMLAQWAGSTDEQRAEWEAKIASGERL